MQIIIRLIIPALITIALNIIFRKQEKYNGDEIIKNLKNEHIILRLPKIYLWIGCITMVCALAFSILMLVSQSKLLYLEIVWFIMFISGLFIVESQIVWQIHIFRSEEYFIYRTAFFKTYKIFYKECISYRTTNNALVVKTDWRTFHIDMFVTNSEFLGAMLMQHNVKEIK